MWILKSCLSPILCIPFQKSLHRCKKRFPFQKEIEYFENDPPLVSKKLMVEYMCRGLNSHYFHIIGDSHHPNSMGLLIIRWDAPIPNIRSLSLPKTNIFASENGWLQYVLVSFWGQQATSAEPEAEDVTQDGLGEGRLCVKHPWWWCFFLNLAKG